VISWRASCVVIEKRTQLGVVQDFVPIGPRETVGATLVVVECCDHCAAAITLPEQKRYRGKGQVAMPDEYRRRQWRQTSLTDLNVPACLPLEIEVTGTERWIRGSVG
jgi:hypothetical protein